MLDDPLEDSVLPSLGPEEVDRLLTAAFGRVSPARHADPDRPVFEDVRLEVLKPLGHGGLGAVYLCRDRRMKREVALKVLRARHSGNIAARDGLLWEARLGSTLDHPGIIPVHEVGVDDTGRPFFTMRVVRGHTLRPVLLTERTGEAGRARLLRILLQIAEAVAHAHTEGIVHSDLKPENVMVGPNGEVLVLDWGLARRRDDDDDKRASSASAKAGTPAYMAPERGASLPPPLSPAVDVFALGVMLLEVLAGPEAAATTSSATVPTGAGAALAKQLDATHPADLVSLAVQSIATPPEDRPADAAGFAAHLSSALERIEDGARQARLDAAAATARADAERRVRRTVQGLSAVVLVTAGIAGAVWVRAERGRERRRMAEVTEIQDALDESHTLTAGADLAASLTSLRQASDLLERAARNVDAEVLPPHWVERLEARRSELALQLTAVEAQAAELRWRKELCDALAAARLRGLAGVHDTGLGRAFALALENAGMNPMATTATELAPPYSLDAVRDQLVDSLDTWAMFGLSLESTAREPESRRLTALAQELDPEPDRREVRAAVLASDVDALERLIPTSSSPPFESPSSYVILGATFAGDGDLARSHAVWREGCFAFPDDPWCHVLLGYDWDGRGVEGARDHLWAAIALEPGNPAAWTNLAGSYTQEGRGEDALRVFRHVAEILRPESTVALKNYWMIQHEMGQLEGALATAHRWQTLEDGGPEASGAVVLTLNTIGRGEEALEEQRRLAQRWREEGASHGAPIAYAEALWRTGALEEARLAFSPREDGPREEAVKRRFCMGRVAQDDGEYEEAIGHFEEVQGDSEYGAQALAFQGLALAMLDRLVEARERLERAHALGAAEPGWNIPTGQWLEVVEADLRLDALIAEEIDTEDAREYANAGKRALEKGDPARSFELYRLAFEPDPEAAEVPLIEGAHAALRALGELDSVGTAADDERDALYRATAARWLRYHFDELERMHAMGRVANRWLDDLRSWETDPVFAAVREPAALEHLPEPAREAWTHLWGDVRRFLEGLDDDDHK